MNRFTKRFSWIVLHLVPTIPTSVMVNITSAGILLSWKESLVRQGAVKYRLMGLKNGSRQVFCSKCGLQYLLNNTEPNTNYSAWVRTMFKMATRVHQVLWFIFIHLVTVSLISIEPFVVHSYLLTFNSFAWLVTPIVKF